MSSMTCETVRTLLDDDLDGELPEEGRERLALHLAGCAACRDEAAALRRLVAEARELPAGIEPARDLWPRVAARLAGASSRRPARSAAGWSFRLAAGPFRLAAGPFRLAAGHFRLAAGPFRLAAGHWRLVAAALLLVAVTAGLTVLVVRRPELGAGGRLPAPDAPPATAAAFDRDLPAAREQLRQALAVRLPTLAPATRQVVEENLRVIDRAIDQIEVALGSAPGDPGLQLKLAAAYRRELDLMSQASRLPRAGGGV